MVATASTKCFSQQELAQFASGTVDVDQLERMEAHIDTCGACQATISELDESPDSFVANLKQFPAQEEVDEESACRVVVDQLVQHHGCSSHEPEELPQIPQSIGGYRVLELAGMGGMGMVYKAQHPKLKRLVAIKLLPMQRSSGPAAIARFQREMEVIGSLDHPNIVRASDAGEEEGMHYLVMDYVDGLDLSRLVRRAGPLGVAEACEIVRQAAQGLAHVHEASLVHRDIKPSNIMVTRDGHVKILDLGLAMLSQQYLEGENNLTTIGQLMGTLDYMAPEQAADSHQVDARADIYSLGATLFQLLTGQAPYGGAHHNSLLKKVLALASAPVPSARALRGDLPEALDEIILKCLAKEPDGRYANVHEMADALSPFATDADLEQLMRRATEKPEPERFRRSVWSMAAILGQRKEHNAAAVKPAAGRGGRFGGVFQLLAAGALFGFVAAAVMVFRVVTDRGELIVRSEDPNAQIVIRRTSGEPVKEMTLQQGQGTVTIRSGQYLVELAGDADQWTLTPNRFTIARHGRVVVSVERNVAEQPAGMMSGGPGSMGGSMGHMGGMPGGMMGGAADSGGSSMTPSGGGGEAMMGPGGMMGPGSASATGAPPMGTGPAAGSMPDAYGGMPGGMEGSAGMSSGMAGSGAMMGMSGGMGMPGMSGGGMAAGMSMPGMGGMGMSSSMSPMGMSMGSGGMPGVGGSGMTPYPTGTGAESNEQLKSRLVYDGRSYNDWIAIMDTERSPARLSEAIKAISILAPEAGSDEAAKAMLRVMRAFGPGNSGSSGESRLLCPPALNLLLELEPRGVARAIAQEIQQGNGRSREFLSLVFTELHTPREAQGYYSSEPQENYPDLRRAMRELAPDMMAGLLVMSQSDDPSVASWGKKMMASLATDLKLNGEGFSEVVLYCQKLLHSSDLEEKYLAAIALSQLAPATDGLGNTLIDFLNDGGDRHMAMEAIGRLGPHAPPIAPQLLELLAKDIDKANAVSSSAGMGGMGGGYPGMGPMPVDVWSTGSQVMNTLKQLGQSDEMIPFLRRYAEQPGPYQSQLQQMLEQLENSAGDAADQPDGADSGGGPGSSGE